MTKPRRRSPKQHHPRTSGDPRRRHRQQLEGLDPWLDACVRADEAEARGDAAEALDILSKRLHGPDGALWWRPSRLRRLMQQLLLGPLLPGWATSRWVLDQASQSMLVPDRGRYRQSFDRALTARGVAAADLPGVDELDARVRVADRDWVFRQSYLYDLGGLQAFLAGAAAADLVVGADRIDEWATAPMAAARLISRTPRSVGWERLDDGVRFETANTGSAALIEPGECAIWRVVPIRNGVMFESRPLLVPEPVAIDVADEPADWWARLSEGFREYGEPEINLRAHEFGMLHDVPQLLWQIEVAHGGGLEPSDGAGDEPPDWFPLVMACARRLLGGDGPDHPGQVDAWSCLGAALLEPTILQEVATRSTTEDRRCLRDLADVLAEPAASTCRMLAEGDNLAA